MNSQGHHFGSPTCGRLYTGRGIRQCQKECFNAVLSTFSINMRVSTCISKPTSRTQSFYCVSNRRPSRKVTHSKEWPGLV